MSVIRAASCEYTQSCLETSIDSNIHPSGINGIGAPYVMGTVAASHNELARAASQKVSMARMVSLRKLRGALDWMVRHIR